MKKWISLGATLLLVMILVFPLAALANGIHPCDLELPATVLINITQTPYTGAPAYFPEIIITGECPLNGTFVGWCVDIDAPITLGIFPANVYLNYCDDLTGLVRFPENADLVNWLLDHAYVGKISNGATAFTYGDVQIAIWTLLEGNIPPYSPTALMLGPFDNNRVAQIIAEATNMGEGFVPGNGNVVMVILSPLDAAGAEGQIQHLCVTLPLRESGNCEDGATSTVHIASGGGETPVVKCKWEQQPIAVNPNLEDGDPSHAQAGFQINPPLAAGSTKTIEYYAVVTDEEDSGNLPQVFADVYHPMGSPEPYGPSVVGGVLGLPYFKYEIPFTQVPITTDDIALVQAAWDAGLITVSQGYDLDDIIYELDKGTAKLWWGQAEIDYEQPAGLYDVHVFGVDSNDNLSPACYNQFLYVPVCGIEADFTGIDFGSTKLGVEKMIPGDTIWNHAPGINGATVRNIGNTWASLTIEFDDMGFGKDVNGTWNVNFDARMGSDDTYYVAPILPYEEVTLPNVLGLSMKDELDLSIKIIKGFGAHSGCITLGCVIVPFDDPVPDNIVGIHIAPQDYPQR